MSENPISAELQRFIAQHVQSVEQVEILCLLGEHPQESFHTVDIFRKIQSSESSISNRLRLFASEMLVTAEADGAYRMSPDHQAVAKELATAYRERHLAVIELIYQTPATPIQDFAEAFRLKRKE